MTERTLKLCVLRVFSLDVPDRHYPCQNLNLSSVMRCTHIHQLVIRCQIKHMWQTKEENLCTMILLSTALVFIGCQIEFRLSDEKVKMSLKWAFTCITMVLVNN